MKKIFLFLILLLPFHSNFALRIPIRFLSGLTVGVFLDRVIINNNKKAVLKDIDKGLDDSFNYVCVFLRKIFSGKK